MQGKKSKKIIKQEMNFMEFQNELQCEKKEKF